MAGRRRWGIFYFFIEQREACVEGEIDRVFCKVKFLTCGVNIVSRQRIRSYTGSSDGP
jgi:hypothetical protein